MRKVISILFLVVLMFSVMSLPSFAEGSGILAVSGGEGKPGDEIRVELALDSNPGLITLKASIEWPEGLELKSVSDEKLLSGWTKPAPNVASPYIIRWADPFAEEDNTATGKIATLTFKIKENASLGKKEILIRFAESWALGKKKVSFSETATASIQVNCPEHQYSKEYTDFSETEHSKSCTLCGNTITEKHSLSKFDLKKSPTCTENGEEKAVCSVCKKEIVRSVPASGHKMQKPTITKEPTCTQAGEREGYCTVCKLTSKEELRPIGHSFGNGVITKEATETEAGIKTFTCSICGEEKTEEIPILGTKAPDSAQKEPQTKEGSESQNAPASPTEAAPVPKKNFSFLGILFLIVSAIICIWIFYWYFFIKKK